MKITDIETITFRYESQSTFDEKGHRHPGEPHEATENLTKITTDVGIEGYCFGGTEAANEVASSRLIGTHPLEREPLWQELRRSQRLTPALDDQSLAAVDCALWDFAGRYFDEPVSRVLGGGRAEIPAYASTMVGDDDPNGLGTPEAYADFAEDLVDRGYQAIKLHTWMPPYGHDPERDAKAARAVRDRVGPDIDLMVDSHHWYNREEAYELGQALEELDYKWFEEPMDEYSLSSYEWLTRELNIPIIGPEVAKGKARTRAEWIKRNISDISRVGVFDVGGITPALKTIHLCEAFNVRCEVHGGGAPNLQLLASMSIQGEYYERGLLHPDYEYERPGPGRQELEDPMDDNGFVQVPQRPGLGYNIDWDYIQGNRVN